MPVDVNVNTRSIELFLTDLRQDIDDLRPLWRLVFRNQLREQIRLTFTTDGYGQWPPRKDNLPHPLLRKSGALFRSVTGQRTRGQINIMRRRSWTFGTSIPYASYHEDPRPGSRIPKRSFLESTVNRPAFERELSNNAEQFLRNRIAIRTRRR